MLPHVRWMSWLAERGSLVCRVILPGTDLSWKQAFRWFVPFLMTCVCIISVTCGIRVPVIGSGWAQLDYSRLPLGLLSELHRSENEIPTGTPIL